MAVYLVIGEFGMGKSTHIKNRFLKKTKRAIECYNLIQSDFEGFPCVNDFDEFIDSAIYATNTLFIIDEASTALPDKKPDSKKPFGKKLLTFFLNARKCNNPVFIVYHSLREVPLWLLMYSNFMIRFNTMDQIEIQKRRFKSYPAILESLENFPTIPKYKYDDIVIRAAA